MKTLTEISKTTGSLAAEYRLEREGIETIEYDDGFATYELLPEHGALYIIDIFVRKGARKSGLASQMADEITTVARQHGCRWLLGSVDPRTNGATASVRVLLAYGFEVSHLDGDLVMFKKEID
jgi:GNAT superfamily N-acetyltransferase